MKQNNESARGMTLIEILIVLAIIAMMVSLVVSSIGTGSSQVKKFTGQFARAIRYCFVQSALNHQYYRISLESESGKIQIENSLSPFYMIKEDDKFEEILRDNKDRFSINDSGSSTSAGKGEFALADDDLIDEFTDIPQGIKIAGYQTELQEEVQNGGNIALYFFPRGQTQATLLQICDEDDENCLTLTVHPYTGNVEILDGLVPYEEAFQDVMRTDYE